MTEARKSDLIDIALYLHAETSAAILISETGDRAKAVWLPKSQIEMVKDGAKVVVTVTMPEWLARDKRLI